MSVERLGEYRMIGPVVDSNASHNRFSRGAMVQVNFGPRAGKLEARRDQQVYSQDIHNRRPEPVLFVPVGNPVRNLVRNATGCKCKKEPFVK